MKKHKQLLRNFTLTAIVLLIGLTSIANEPDTAVYQKVASVTDDEKVKMLIEGFWDYGGGYAVFLKEEITNEHIYVPIFIGECEAKALSREKSGVEFPRPLTYPLMTNIMETTGITMKEVVITKIEENTFYAIIVIEQNGKRYELDARPSDAMNLAVRMNSDVYAYRKVIDQAGEKIED